jgi:outer membrane protein assembly factor BamB
MPLASWFQSRPAILVWSVLLPPVGLILLLTRPSTGIARKLVGSLAIVVLGIFYLVVFFGLRLVPDGSGLPKIVTFESPEAHAEALERSRAERPEGGAVPSPAGAATAEAGSIDPAPMGEPKLVSEAAASGGVYWTDFRGPGRDGDYDEMAIRTAWPPEGLTPLWRQPVGGGYASFVIAEGRAFTIEQRRNQEVVAAYDTKTGRELWTQSWGAAFQERMGGDGPRATPTWHEGRVYALGATGELRALDAGTGKILWAKNGWQPLH